MSDVFNIYCDESSHLEHDHQNVMVLGAVWCARDKVKDIATRLREIKQRHALNARFELKWIKVSPAKLPFYQEVLDYFFDDDDLHFRVIVIPEKDKLRHEDFSQTHDEWYYKMQFNLLKVILDPTKRYRIFLDKKDTRGANKVRRLHEVLSNNLYDFSRSIVASVQTIESNQVPLLQLTDLLIGAVAYANRGLTTSQAKLSLVKRMQQRSGYSLMRSTLFREDKVNIFYWRAQEAKR